MSSEDLPEPNPVLISDLFARDPLSLTVTDRRRIIEHYRENRALWVQSGKGLTTKQAAAKKQSPTGKIDLADIGL